MITMSTRQTDLAAATTMTMIMKTSPIRAVGVAANSLKSTNVSIFYF